MYEGSPRRIARSLLRDVRNIGFALRHCRKPIAVIREVVRSGPQPSATLRNGTTITAPEIRTLLSLLGEIFVDRAYEHGVVRVAPGDVVVDIGAHVGTFTIYAMQMGARRVIAYEPLADNVRLLRANVARNIRPERLMDVDIVEAAVGDREGTTALGIGRVSVGNVVIDAVPNEPTSGVVSVYVATLAGLMREHGLDRIDYLKIDCEGSEGVLLSATSDDDLRRIDRIAIEYHDNWSSLDRNGIAARLRAAGFVVDIVPNPGAPYGMVYAAQNRADS